MKIKIIDFQLCMYKSFVHDLIFFLFTSVRPTDLKENFTSFINYYYTAFIKTLAYVNCPLDDYTFEKYMLVNCAYTDFEIEPYLLHLLFRMWDEIQQKAKIELLHVLFMIKMITFDTSSSQKTRVDPKVFYDWIKLPQNVQTRWKLLMEIFSENEFI